MVFISLLLFFYWSNGFSQIINSTKLQAFGHTDFETVITDDTIASEFSLGEQELLLMANSIMSSLF